MKNKMLLTLAAVVTAITLNAVAADVIVLFKKRKVVASVEKVRAAEAGDTRADDRDFSHRKI